MADINHVISLGIGTPADIKHFILVGLSPGDLTVGWLTGSISTMVAVDGVITAWPAVTGNVEVVR